jgi:hypothetical protein
MQRMFLGREKVVKFLGAQGKWQEIADIYQTRAPLDTTRHSIWPLGLIHLPAGVVAASLAEDEDAIQLICGLMVERFQAVTNPQTATEVALAFLQPHYSLPLLAALEPQSGLAERIAGECRTRYQAAEAVDIWDRIRWGGAEFRWGDREATLVVLEPALSHHRTEASGIAHAYSALAATALRRNEPATRFLQTARSKYEQLLSDSPERLAQDWHQFARLEQLISEAEGGLQQR